MPAATAVAPRKSARKAAMPASEVSPNFSYPPVSLRDRSQPLAAAGRLTATVRR